MGGLVGDEPRTRDADAPTGGQGARRLRDCPGYVGFWAASTTSDFGTYVTTLALQVLVVVTLHGSAAEVGLVNAARWVPYPLFGLVAGVLVDRYRRQPVLVGSDLGRGVLLGVIPLLAGTGSRAGPAHGRLRTGHRVRVRRDRRPARQPRLGPGGAAVGCRPYRRRIPGGDAVGVRPRRRRARRYGRRPVGRMGHGGAGQFLFGLALGTEGPNELGYRLR